ncbi:MAG: PEP-CTERM sorting domain-containing protein [Symploca sp. SIO2C1]|nr:PEP-CTERM sorting domain-containing protein [Symploca sp. SIO2C1]
MNWLINMVNCKTVTTIGVVTTMVSFLVPAPAEALLLNFKSSVGSSKPIFDLNTDSVNQSNSDTSGFYPGAIQNFEFGFPPDRLKRASGDLSVQICCNSDYQLDEVTQEFEESFELPGVQFKLQEDANIYQYSITFKDEDFAFNFFVPSAFSVIQSEPAYPDGVFNFSYGDPQDFVSSLVGLNQLVAPQTPTPKVDNGLDLYVLYDNTERNQFIPYIKTEVTDITNVPEPSTLASLFVLGALGTSSLLKSNRKQKKVVG